jgi:hypothetical protein
VQDSGADDAGQPCVHQADGHPVVSVERDDAAWEVVDDPTEQLVSFIGPQVHGQSFGNDQGRQVSRHLLLPLLRSPKSRSSG